MTITVSYSSASTFGECPRQFYYKYVLHKEAPELDSATNVGKWGHNFLQGFYNYYLEGMSKEEALKHAKQMLPDPVTPQAVLAWCIVETYVNELPLNDLTLVVEENFILPINDKISVAFLPDRVFQQQDGRVIVEDYKFSGRMWSGTVLSRYAQLKLYAAFLRRCGYDVSKAYLRIFNTSNGKLNTIPFVLRDQELDRLYSEFIVISKRIQRYLDLPEREKEKEATRTLNSRTCQYCKFVLPCNMQAEGRDASKVLELEYKTKIKRNTGTSYTPKDDFFNPIDSMSI